MLNIRHIFTIVKHSTIAIVFFSWSLLPVQAWKTTEKTWKIYPDPWNMMLNIGLLFLKKWLLIIINIGDNLIIFKDFSKSFGTFRSNLKWPLINLACLSIDTARGGKRNWKKSLDFSNFGEPHFGQNFEILSNNYKSFFSF